VAPLIQSKITWIPGDAKLVSTWNDDIMGNHPIELKQELIALRDWMERQDVKTLYDLSLWAKDGSHWVLSSPTHLTPLVPSLFLSHIGCALVDKTLLNEKGWVPNGNEYSTRT